jgi:hypothetical protein
MAKSLEERYEEAAEKVRSSDGEPSAADKTNYHKLRDELRAQAEARRADQPDGAVTADRVEVG